VIGVMGAALPMNGTAWLRVIAVEEALQAEPILAALWQAVARDLARIDTHTVYLLMINDWMEPFVPGLGFAHQEDIVTLRRDGGALPDHDIAPVQIRSAEADDLARLLDVDNAAFVAPWQMSVADLRHARRIAASCTVAMQGRMIVGYQLSTLYRWSGHLARLAVLPDLQGKGVGAALVADLIQRLLRRGVRSLTVNTQASNHRSQRLYLRYGFERNGYDLGVWQAHLSRAEPDSGES
jgi:ribosomal-protein-alanine N-acetyltransferase